MIISKLMMMNLAGRQQCHAMNTARQKFNSGEQYQMSERFVSTQHATRAWSAKAPRSYAGAGIESRQQGQGREVRRGRDSGIVINPVKSGPFAWPCLASS